MLRIATKVDVSIEQYTDEGDLRSAQPLPQPLHVAAMGSAAFLRAWAEAGAAIAAAAERALATPVSAEADEAGATEG